MAVGTVAETSNTPGLKGSAPMRQLSRLLSQSVPTGACVAAVIVLPAACEGTLWVQHPLLPVVNLLVSGTGAWAGALLIADPDQRGAGWALILAAIVRPLSWSGEWAHGPLPLVSVVFGYSDTALAAWALLRYPDNRLDLRGRRYTIVLASWLILIPVLQVCFGRPQWMSPDLQPSVWWFSVRPDHRVFSDITQAFSTGSALFAVVFLAYLLQRLRVGGRQDRAVRLPVVAAGMVAALASAAIVLVTAVPGPNNEVFYAIEGLAELGVPVAFLVSYGQQRLLRLSSLVSVFDETTSTIHVLRQALRVNLRDPELDLAVWSDADSSYYGVEGAPLDLHDVVGERVLEPVIGRNGRNLGMLLISSTVARDRGIVGAALVISRLALENFHLSRRLLTADYDARQRIVADLHDGAQKELCALLVVLSGLRRADDTTRAGLLNEAAQCAEDALSELRDLAHGVYPQTLTHAGLGAAIVEAADRLDLLVHTSTPDHRLPSALEKSVYFFCCEALTNASKHAGAAAITVDIRHEGVFVVARVQDDGVGGADPRGPGLARLRDRIEAHAGQMTVHSPVGGGTRLTARVPCV